MADYRPRDAQGRFLPAAKIPAKVRKAIQKAREVRRVAEEREAQRLAEERSERARKAAKALAARRRREFEERNRVKVEAAEAERLAAEREAARLAAEAAEAARLAAEAAAAAKPPKKPALTAEEKKARRKERRKELRREHDEEIRLQKLALEQRIAEEKLRAEQAARDAVEAREREMIEAEARMDEQIRRQELEDLYREPEVVPEIPQVPEERSVPAAAGAAEKEELMSGVVVTPEEIMELAMREMREEALLAGLYTVPRTDAVLVRNVSTRTLGMAIRVGRIINEPGLAEDLATVAKDVAEQILGVAPGSLVFVSIQMTEWGPVKGFAGSIDKVLASGANGTLAQTWQGTRGKNNADRVERAVLQVIRNKIVSSSRASAMVESITVRGFTPVDVR